MSKENIDALAEVMSKAKEGAVSISSKYLSIENGELAVGSVIPAFHLGYKFEYVSKIDEKTGEETKEPKHTAMFLARIDKKFQIYISSSKVLAETIGNYDLETCAAIEITYLGRKGAVGKKAGMWSVDALPMNLFDHEHLLPENMKPIMNMARNMKRMQIEKRAKIDALMSATTEKNGYAELTHDGD